ncbi:hypothetical protein [Anaerosolibacter sp.]|uniref:hypothetical protein n=1 Tax=Anaerosolibacter sp. TaxID=1872527 RepID=UPI0039EFEE03
MKAKPNGEMMQIFEKAFDMLKENKNSLTYDLEETEIDYMEEDIEKFNGMLHRKGYEVKNGTIVRKNGESRDLVCNFFIMPKCYVHYYDNDFIRTQKVCLKVYCSEEEEVIYLLLNIDELGSLAWVNEYLDLKYKFDNDKNYKEISEMIQLMCRRLNKLAILDYYCGTGWMKKYNGTWSYKYGNRSIVNTISRDKRLFIQRREKYCQALSMLEVAHKSVTIPMLSFAVLSVVKEILKEANIEPNFTLAVTGNNKKYILRLVGLFTNIFNNDIKERLNWGTYGSISDSAENIKRKVSRFKDSLLVIDAYSEGSKTLNKSLDQFLSNYLEITEYNEAARENNTYGLNRLCLLVKNEIVRNDLFCNICVNDIDINVEQVKEIHISDSLIFIFYSMVEALRKELKRNETRILRAFKNHFSYYKKLFFNNTLYTERMSEILSWLLIGLKLFLEYGRKIDAISEDEAIKIFNEAISIFSNEKNFEEEAGSRKLGIMNTEEDTIYQLMEKIYYMYENEKETNFLDLDKNKIIEDGYIGWYRGVGYENSKKACILIDKTCIANIQDVMMKKYSFKIELNYKKLRLQLNAMDITFETEGQSEAERGTHRIAGKGRYIAIEVDKLKKLFGNLGNLGIWENSDHSNDSNG